MHAVGSGGLNGNYLHKGCSIPSRPGHPSTPMSATSDVRENNGREKQVTAWVNRAGKLRGKKMERSPAGPCVLAPAEEGLGTPLRFTEVAASFNGR